MTLTSIFCRTQEALQRDRAAAADLENVRVIATRASIAWAHAATLANSRETQVRRGPAHSAATPLHMMVEHDLLNENPDRGRASE